MEFTQNLGQPLFLSPSSLVGLVVYDSHLPIEVGQSLAAILHENRSGIQSGLNCCFIHCEFLYSEKPTSSMGWWGVQITSWLEQLLELQFQRVRSVS